jgi:uncharacterized protein with HEPN domain
MNETKDLLKDMLSAAWEAISYLEGFNEATFVEDSRTLRACERCLEIIGEAAGAVNDDFKGQHPNIPWAKAKGMRNLIIHEYRYVQYRVVYVTITESLPPLIASLEALIRETPE